jgi:phosphopantetheine--protein transferase-like protein
MMQEKIKEIIAVFLKVLPDQVSAATIIDRSAVSSSILLHRMYAKLAAEGIAVNNYQDVRTVSDLLQKVNGASQTSVTPATGEATTAVIKSLPAAASPGSGVGVDIEAVSAMPVTGDFREDAFYTMYFSPAEIAWCILKPNPYASFAGLFAAKEAIVKADNKYKKTVFNQIIITHTEEGKPLHASFQLSIAHTEELAIAIALPNTEAAERTAQPAVYANNQATTAPAVWLAILLSLLLSVIALWMTVKR